MLTHSYVVGERSLGSFLVQFSVDALKIATMLDDYLRRWNLIPDGSPIETRSSRLLPVRHLGEPAMLKVSLVEEEKRGNAVMAWWDGSATAPVLAQDQDAILMERASGEISLGEFCRDGRDDEATRVICAVIGKLHAVRPDSPPPLTPLTRWFRALEAAAATHSGIFRVSAAAARDILANQKNVVPLHGDVHHGNVLHFGLRGWLAIDPKGLCGERGFDYANLFCNPDHPIATDPVLFAQRLATVTHVAGLERQRLLIWILAWAGLSAAWHLEDGTPPETALCVAEMAAAQCRLLRSQ